MPTTFILQKWDSIVVSSLDINFLINNALWKSFQANLFKYNSLFLVASCYKHTIIYAAISLLVDFVLSIAI